MKLNLKTTTVKNLIDTLGLLKSDVNLIKFIFNMKDAKDYVINQATIVNKGVQFDVGFSATTKTKKTEPVEVIVATVSFINAAATLLKFGSDLDVEITKTQLILSVPGKTVVPLSRVEKMTELLPNDLSSCLAQVKMKPSALTHLFTVGGAYSEADNDLSCIKDRIAFCLTANQFCAYTTDGHGAAKAVDSCVGMLNLGTLAFMHLAELKKTMSDAEKETLAQEMATCQAKENDEERTRALVELAKSKDMKEEILFSILNTNASVISSAIKTCETDVNIIVCSKFAYIKASNVTITISLTQGIASIYKTNVEPQFSVDAMYKFTTDKSDFVNALSVMKLVTEDVPVKLSGEDGSLKFSRGTNTCLLKVTKSKGDISKLNISFRTDILFKSISLLPNGNVTMHLSPDIFPIFTAGDADASKDMLKEYIMTLPIRTVEEKKAEAETAAEDATSEDVTE